MKTRIYAAPAVKGLSQILESYNDGIFWQTRSVTCGSGSKALKVLIYHPIPFKGIYSASLLILRHK